jgi:hypothetical protein
MHTKSAICALVLLACGGNATAADAVRAPVVSEAPKLEDFAEMHPRGAATQLAHVANFIQQRPSDGQPATQRTDVYIGRTPCACT